MDELDLFSEQNLLPHKPQVTAKPASSSIDDSSWLALDEYAERAYLEYALSVVKGRALPDVTDGQKPVQRRILYAMKDMGLTNAAKPVKSARVVGETLGKYHPHGDSSAYEAMVRMAQSFTLRYPLIDGQGNFGSRDGDGPAAMRYTEARLTAVADLLLAEIDLGTVDFIDNYDGSYQEPKLLPARLPMVLLNGASGIAVGLATEIPPHNMREIALAAEALLRNPELTNEKLFSLLPGPDFPGGGQIISAPEDIFSAYISGKGSIRVRACWEIEKLARGQWRLIVHELPPFSSAQKIQSEIEEATNPKLRSGKKTLSQEQQNLKNLMLSMLDRVRDESDGEHPVRLVFEPKSSRIEADEFISLLLAQTSLEGNVPLNLVLIDGDGRPGQRGLRAILKDWLDFRVCTVTRRLAYRLAQVERRIHILEGRMIAFLNIDEVIHVIRESDEPKPSLIKAFGLSEIQAEDILEIRLRQLARLEGFKLETELGELKFERDNLNNLLNNDAAKQKLIIEEIRADAKKYGDARRTQIETAERASLKQTTADEPITIILSKKGWLRARSGHNLDLSLTSFKDGDRLGTAIETRTTYPLVVLDQNGRAYSIDPAELPSGRGDGVPVASLVELQDNANVAHIISATADTKFLFANSAGYGFIANIINLTGRSKAGKFFMNLNPGEDILKPVLLEKSIDLAAAQIVVAASNGRVLAFALSEIKELSKGRGLLLMQLTAEDKIIDVCCIADTQSSLQVFSKTLRGKIVSEKMQVNDFIGKRGKRGKISVLKGSLLGLSGGNI